MLFINEAFEMAYVTEFMSHTLNIDNGSLYLLCTIRKWQIYIIIGYVDHEKDIFFIKYTISVSAN